MSPPLRKLYDNAEFAEGFDPAEMDRLDELADKWMADQGVQRLLDGLGEAYNSAVPDIGLQTRFRQMLSTVAHQCYVEGALRMGASE
jgi:hypothetical protein